MASKGVGWKGSAKMLTMGQMGQTYITL